MNNNLYRLSFYNSSWWTRQSKIVFPHTCRCRTCIYGLSLNLCVHHRYFLCTTTKAHEHNPLVNTRSQAENTICTISHEGSNNYEKRSRNYDIRDPFLVITRSFSRNYEIRCLIIFYQVNEGALHSLHKKKLEKLSRNYEIRIS